MTAVCDLCPHACRLREDETGFCRARTNVGGVIRPTNYGRLTALALDLPLHISRYFPRHRMQTPPTPIATIDALTAVAARHLRHVHRGNC